MTGTDERLKKQLDQLTVPEPDDIARRAALQAAQDQFDRQTRKKPQGIFSFGRLTGQKPKGGPVMKRPFAIAASVALAVSALIAIALPNFLSYRSRGTVEMERAPIGRLQPPTSLQREKVAAAAPAGEPLSEMDAVPSPGAPAGPTPSAQVSQKPPALKTATSKPEELTVGDRRPGKHPLARTNEQPAAPLRVAPADKSVALKRPGGVVGTVAEQRHRLPAPAVEMPMPPPDAGMSGRDRFEAVADNPLKTVAEAPVSTFSIDVDTASYAFVRRALNSGVLPQKNAVRVEEMINYFDYDYPLPETREVPFRPTVAVFPTPWNPHTKLLHIGLKGHTVIPDQRPRANLVFLVDVSGSMRGPDRLPLLKNALRMLVSALEPDDTVALVVYAGAAGTVLEPTPVRDKGRILAALDQLRSGGSTAGGAGIRLAYDLARAHFDPEGVNRVILATDGDFNVGIRNTEELKGFIERQRRTGVFLSVLGFGQGNYNDALMQALAQNGNGNAAYIDTLNEARKVLVEEATATLFPIAKDVKIQVEFNPALVAEYRLIGYETRMLRREDFNNDRVDAGEVGAGHSVTAIYEITPVSSPAVMVDRSRYGTSSQAAGGHTPPAFGTEYAFLKLRYKLPEEDHSRKLTVPVTTSSESATLAAAPAEPRFAAAVAAFGMILRGDRLLGDFSYDDVVRLAQPVRGTDPYGYRAEFLNLVRLARTARAMTP